MKTKAARYGDLYLMATKVRVTKKGTSSPGAQSKVKPSTQVECGTSAIKLLSPINRDELDSLVGMSCEPEQMAIGRRSEIVAGELCPRFALLSYLYGLRPVARSPGRDQSSYAHMTIALLLRGMKPMAVIDVLDQIMQDVAASSRRPTDPERAQDVSLGFACGCYIYDKLVDHVKAKGFKIRNVEHKFSGTIQISHQWLGITVDIPFRFQTDFVLEAPSGALYWWDTKVIGTSSELYATQMKMGLQASVYTLWGSTVPELSGRLKGGIFGICSKPSCSRKGLTKGEGQDLNDYVKEVYENLEGVGRWSKMAEKRQTEKAMQVVSKICSQEDLNRAAHRLAEWCARKQRGRNNMAFPAHDNCVHGYMTCDMLDLCQYDQSMWRGLVHDPSGSFTTDPDPLNSERLHGSELKPVEVPDVIPKKLFGSFNDIFERKDKGLLTTKWRDFVLP